ncbi:MAG: hypothetical protein IPP93_18845 [Chitinophagaceae bacterium]|nr:hypothetical protein [Chitinophagaceae bacterium]MBL0333838.1 hypothetical protein [Chitinophagaceae bacterium]
MKFNDRPALFSAGNSGGLHNKELPPFNGEAKVREIKNWKNFVPDFFACFQSVVNKVLKTPAETGPLRCFMTKNRAEELVAGGR